MSRIKMIDEKEEIYKCSFISDEITLCDYTDSPNRSRHKAIPNKTRR